VDVVHVRPQHFTRTALPFLAFELPAQTFKRIPEAFTRQLSAAWHRLEAWRSVLEVLTTPEVGCSRNVS